MYLIKSEQKSYTFTILMICIQYYISIVFNIVQGETFSAEIQHILSLQLLYWLGLKHFLFG